MTLCDLFARLARDFPGLSHDADGIEEWAAEFGVCADRRTLIAECRRRGLVTKAGGVMVVTIGTLRPPTVYPAELFGD